MTEKAMELMRKQQVRPIVEVGYKEVAGPKAGEPIAENQTVSLEQSSFDLGNYRRGMGETLEEIENQQIREAIDQLRAGEQPQQQQQPPVEQPQPEQPQYTQEQAQQLSADDH